MMPIMSRIHGGEQRARPERGGVDTPLRKPSVVQASCCAAATAQKRDWLRASEEQQEELGSHGNT